MLVVFLIAVAVVLGGVFFAATGRGGEMAPEHPDHAPLDLGPVSAPDIALLRPPTSLWGYNVEVTDEALDHIARAMRERDVTIAHLQQQLASREVRDPDVTRPDASQVPSAPQTPQPLQAPQPLQTSQPPWATQPLQAPQSPQVPKAPGILVAPLPHRATQPAEAIQPAEAAQPTETRSASPAEVPGPQGSYDAHDWWAQQEEAAREEALRQAQAQARPEAEASSGESGPPEAAGPPADGSAGRDDSRPGRTGTQPNPAIASPPGTPDDEALAVTEEQAW